MRIIPKTTLKKLLQVEGNPRSGMMNCIIPIARIVEFFDIMNVRVVYLKVLLLEKSVSAMKSLF